MYSIFYNFAHELNEFRHILTIYENYRIKYESNLK